jgi:protein-tyrosine-phosphatase
MMTIALSVLLLLGGQASTAADPPPGVLFVCEHGAAKSLIAALYFNKLAAERDLPVRAAFRGVTPQDDLSARAVKGLRADGFAIPDEKPSAIAPDDVIGATHIFAIGCTLAGAAASSGKAVSWDDVPDDQGYPAMRDAIVAHVRALLDEIEREE